VAIAIVYGALFESVQRAQARHGASVAHYSSRLVFDPSVPLQDREWIVQAVAHARPEAVRLIERIDADTYVTTLRTLPGGFIGYAQRTGSRRFQVNLNLARLDTDASPDRELTVLHELGHVVDGLLVPQDLRDRLAAEVPRSGSCPYGTRGDCAPPAEKFADTFAKWAFRGAVPYRTGAGYLLPLPPKLDAWGEPLAHLR